MSRTPLAVFIAIAIATLAVYLGTYARGVEPCPTSTPGQIDSTGTASATPCKSTFLRRTGLKLKPVAPEIVLVASGLILLVTFVERLVVRHHYRKQVVEGFLNEVVATLFDGDGKANRLTLFKQVGPFRARFISYWRLRHQDSPDAKPLKRAALARMGWTGKYLYVYARATVAHNKLSSTVWRVYGNRQSSEGVAGFVWDSPEEVILLRGLHPIDPSTIPDKTPLEALSGAVREYAKRARVTDARQLRAMRRVPQHFIGTVIQTQGGRLWGVLLVDSMKSTCPFPAEKNAKHKRQFGHHAKMVSLLIS